MLEKKCWIVKHRKNGFSYGFLNSGEHGIYMSMPPAFGTRKDAQKYAEDVKEQYRRSIYGLSKKQEKSIRVVRVKCTFEEI